MGKPKRHSYIATQIIKRKFLSKNLLTSVRCGLQGAHRYWVCFFFISKLLISAWRSVKMFLIISVAWRGCEEKGRNKKLFFEIGLGWKKTKQKISHKWQFFFQKACSEWPMSTGWAVKRFVPLKSLIVLVLGDIYEKVYTQTLVTRALRFKNKRQKSLVWKHQGHISSWKLTRVRIGDNMLHGNQ